jgi:hypothetical protein
MVDVTLMVITSDDGKQTRELATVALPGVPRVGETVCAKGDIFEVRRVVWFDVEDMVTIDVFSKKYGTGFPFPREAEDSTD